MKNAEYIRLTRKTRWTDFYNTEEELLRDMLLTLSDEKTTPYYKLVKGYGYIDSFKRYYAKNRCLTPKQMTQLKRLAGEVYKNVHEVNTVRRG